MRRLSGSEVNLKSQSQIPIFGRYVSFRSKFIIHKLMNLLILASGGGGGGLMQPPWVFLSWTHRHRNSFQVGGQNFWYKDSHFSRRARCNFLSAAQLKEIDRLRCFVVINFHIAVFHPLFRNVKKFSKSTMGLWANGITHFPTAMSDLSWRKCEKT